ncbi:MAG: hypothetical protein ACKOQ8_02380 [Micrococcales bacterium]
MADEALEQVRNQLMNVARSEMTDAVFNGFYEFSGTTQGNVSLTKVTVEATRSDSPQDKDVFMFSFLAFLYTFPIDSERGREFADFVKSQTRPSDLDFRVGELGPPGTETYLFVGEILSDLSSLDSAAKRLHEFFLATNAIQDAALNFFTGKSARKTKTGDLSAQSPNPEVPSGASGRDGLWFSQDTYSKSQIYELFLLASSAQNQVLGEAMEWLVGFEGEDEDITLLSAEVFDQGEELGDGNFSADFLDLLRSDLGKRYLTLPELVQTDAGDSFLLYVPVADEELVDVFMSRLEQISSRLSAQSGKFEGFENLLVSKTIELIDSL